MWLNWMWDVGFAFKPSKKKKERNKKFQFNCYKCVNEMKTDGDSDRMNVTK